MVLEPAVSFRVNTTTPETKKMIRYSLFLTVVFGLAIFGLTKLAPAHSADTNMNNVTVIYQSTGTSGSHPVVLQSCAKEDCSDTAQ